jgi:hypothetical protein
MISEGEPKEVNFTEILSTAKKPSEVFGICDFFAFLDSADFHRLFEPKSVDKKIKLRYILITIGKGLICIWSK